MRLGEPIQYVLDYGSAASEPLLRNLSCAALIGEHLWTVSDEGRSLECLKRNGDGFALEHQYQLDALFGGLLEGGPDDEIDLEAMSFDQGRLWLCGSHCRVRRKPAEKDHLDPRLRRRPSRHLFGSVGLDREGKLDKSPAMALPALGRNSLRRTLREDPYLAPFIGLPSKEGGLDIEGLLVRRERAFIGCRGPLIDSMAVVIELALSDKLRRGASVEQRHFINLGGLGIRGLAQVGKDILIIGGPVADAPGPFRLFSWRPQTTERIQEATVLLDWPITGEKPEGICPLPDSDGVPGLLVLFDSPADSRLSGSTYLAEWRQLSLAA